MNIEKNYKTFDDYVSNFDLNEDAIKRKYDHSYRVVSNSKRISEFLELNDNDTYLACLIGLLHDIGRFEQWTKYQTYSDYKSIDHALLGAKILFEDGLINDFVLEQKDYELVKKAIVNHNLYKINRDLNDKELLFSKIIRDADKLDILSQLSANSNFGLEEDNSEISEKVRNEFYKHNCINNKDKLTKNDNIIMKMALVYDLNFDYSKKMVLKNLYLDKMLGNLKNKEKFNIYIEEAKKYLGGKNGRIRKEI